jgi:hypothetical protein
MTGSTQAKRAALGRSFAASTIAARVVLGRILLGATLLALAGCSSSTFGGRSGTYTCPQAQIVPDLQTLVQFPPGANTQNTQAILSAGRVNSVTTSCEREGDTGVVASVGVEFTGLRTQAALAHLNLPYFVALADSDGNILGKQQFIAGMDFKPDTPVGRSADNVTVHLPLKNAQLGNVYTLILGFQLSQAQLNYNRAHLK